jgi:TonB family protein
MIAFNLPFLLNLSFGRLYEERKSVTLDRHSIFALHMYVRRLLCLISAFVLGAGLLACTSSKSASEQWAEDNAVDPKFRKASPEFTPDSLVQRPDSVFFRSERPRAARAISKGTAVPCSVEVIGSVDEGRAHWALHVGTHVGAKRKLTADPYVAVRSDSMILFRGHTWRTLDESGRSYVDRRFVPLSPADVQRLLRSDTTALGVNGRSYLLSPGTRRDLHEMAKATPDSLPLDVGAVISHGSAYTTVDEKPRNTKEVAFSVLQKMNYPETAKRKGIQGVVYVRFIVLPNGSPVHRRVVKGVHPLLDEEAYEAVGEGTYEPGRVNGKPVPTLMTLPITFRRN